PPAFLAGCGIEREQVAVRRAECQQAIAETGACRQRQTGLDRPNLVAGLGVERRYLPVIGAREDARAVGRGTQAEPQALRLATDLATPNFVDDDRRLKIGELGGRLALVLLPAAAHERDGERQHYGDANPRDHSPSSGFGCAGAAAEDAASAGASAASAATSGAPAAGAAAAVGVGAAPGRSESFICKNPRSRSSAPGATIASRYAVRAASVSPRAAWMSPLISAIRPANWTGSGTFNSASASGPRSRYASTRASRRRATIASSGSSLFSIVNLSFSAASSGAVTISALASSIAA